MPSTYFHRVSSETATRLWINNPSGPETDWAIEAGAINCTTNPAYCSRLLQSDPVYLEAVIDGVIRETRDDDEAADRVYQASSARIMARFMSLFEASRGECGYVTMQSDPRDDEDAEAIVAAARRYRALGPNFMTKIPVTRAGLQAIEVAVAENLPICATEIFSIAQARAVCDLYEQIAEKTGNRPPFYVTHITGIFDEYLQKVAKREGISVAPAVLKEAGCAVARKECEFLRERGYRPTMLGGGARDLYHFTEMVGGDIHVTINWSTAKELIDLDGPVVDRMPGATAQETIDELRETLPDFRKAYDEDGLSVDEFEAYGPVRLFRNAFLKGWYLLLAEVVSRRHAQAI